MNALRIGVPDVDDPLHERVHVCVVARRPRAGQDLTWRARLENDVALRTGYLAHVGVQVHQLGVHAEAVNVGDETAGVRDAPVSAFDLHATSEVESAAIDEKVKSVSKIFVFICVVPGSRGASHDEKTRLAKMTAR
ncbi:MAG TPA: hypothetical protein VH062_27725 [Polyangiaceae bacterium]|nr:hypothetical protein [Polyangiaceae bacterium]